MAADQSPKIVVSYRRSDAAMAGRIFDRLVQRFGTTSLFIDIDNIPYGADFRQHIEDALKSSDLLIALVGEKWLGSRKGSKARILSETDPVRVELETAFGHNIKILPVLLDNSKMPDPRSLPDNIKNFAYLNAIDVESGRDFKAHVERLIEAIEQILGFKSSSPGGGAATAVAPMKKRDPKFMLIGAGLIAVLLGAGAWLLRDQFASQDGTASPEFCDTFEKVMDESHLKFESILGPKTYILWIARIQLPGWEDCRIGEYTDSGAEKPRYYTCQLPSFASFDAVDARLSAERKNVMGCLGPGWIESRQTYAAYIGFTYSGGQTDPLVSLIANHDETQKIWILTLTVQELAAKPPT